MKQLVEWMHNVNARLARLEKAMRGLDEALGGGTPAALNQRISTPAVPGAQGTLLSEQKQNGAGTKDEWVAVVQKRLAERRLRYSDLSREISGVASSSHLNNICRGKGEPGRVIYEAICSVLQIDPNHYREAVQAHRDGKAHLRPGAPPKRRRRRR